MKYLETENEKKSFIITTVIFVVILILCFFLGLSYLDPPPENGIAINFGTTEFGSGEVQPTEPVASAPQAEQSPSQPTPVADEVATQDVTDAPVIAKEKPSKEIPKEVTKPKEAPKPTPSKETTDALKNLIDGPKNDGKAQGGEGNDNKPGDKGREDGDLKGDYNGNGGKGTVGTGRFDLSGRKALALPDPKYTCNEQGTVVVQIAVDKNGNVISATPGVRGTTNTAKCLSDQARVAAMNAKFNAGELDKQIGTITYNFKLTD